MKRRYGCALGLGLLAMACGSNAGGTGSSALDGGSGGAGGAGGAGTGGSAPTDAGHDRRTPPGDAPPEAQFVRSSLARAPATATDGGTLSDAVAANSSFAFELYARLRSDEENLFFSPFSVSTAMAMAWAGARGTTATEIATVFHFTQETHAALNALAQDLAVDQPDLVTALANALWVSPRVTPRPAYLDLLARDYGSGVGVVDFTAQTEALSTINGWVSQETRGTIPKLLTSLPPNTGAVLTNALYFKGRWANAFTVGATMDAPFTLPSGAKTTVKMMDQLATFRYVQTPDHQAAALQYRARGGRTFEMDVVLPTADLPAFEAGLDGPRLEAIVASLKPTLVEVRMPRFTMRSELSLASTLTAMGMPTAFLPSADFGDVSTPSPGRIGDVIHQGFVSVDENGTEAAAATAIIFVDGSATLLDAAPPVLRLDRPFFVAIRSVETGAILFLGRVANPNAG
jgi:serpin B